MKPPRKPADAAPAPAPRGEGLSDAVRQFTIGADDDGARLDRWFKRHLPQVGFATVSRWARTGQIRLDGKRADPADRIAAGQVLRVPPGGAPAAPAAKAKRVAKPLTDEQRESAEAMLILKTRSALVLNKLPGLATQGGTGITSSVDALLDAYAGEDEPRPRLVHRLDKDTSGVLLVARTPGSAAYFSKNFAGRSARKIYWALVIGVPQIEDGYIELPLAKQPGTGGEKMYVDHVEGQAARTRYRVLEMAGNRAAWVELQPLTGRTHQLRVHMAAIGHPIVGDGKYGGPEAFLAGSISRKLHLHARRLLIDGPGGEKIDVTAELPTHFAASMAQIGFDLSLGFPQDFSEPVPSKHDEKAAARAHAKQYRKARRGERRGRAESGMARPVVYGAAPGKTAGKPAAKGKAPTKSGAKPAARKPAPRKPAPRKP